jgi:hypothetical protein
MSQKRWWPVISTILFAHLFAVLLIGLCEFAFTSTREPMFCHPSRPPWDSLCYWVQSGRKRSLSDLFTAFQIRRFNASIAGLVLFGMGLGWSLWLMRPLRLTVRFRLRTLMATIAVVAIDVTAGADVWNRWERWDHDQRWGSYIARFSSVRQEIYVQLGDSLSVEVRDPLLNPPIRGDRVVRPDGKIDLGRDERVYVDGLTAAETKEKIVYHLQKHLAVRWHVPIAASKLDSLTTVRINR